MNGNTIEREVTITRGKFGDVKSLQTIIIDPKEKSITVNMTKGPMLGTRKTALDFLSEDKTKIEITWEFEMKGLPKFTPGNVEDSISKTTEKGLAKIAEDAESSESTKAAP